MEQQGRHKNLPSTSPSFQSLYSTVEPQLICLASNSRQVRPADIPQHNGTNQCSYLKHRYELFSTGSTTAATPSLHDPSTWACLHICNNKPRLIPQSHTLQSIPKPAIESSHREPFRQHNPARTLRMVCSIRTHHFLQTNGLNTTSKYEKQIYIKNTNWHPPPAPSIIVDKMTEFEKALKNKH
jgi:hypothetical protein